MASSSPTCSQSNNMGPDNTPIEDEDDIWRNLPSSSPEKPAAQNYDHHTTEDSDEDFDEERQFDLANDVEEFPDGFSGGDDVNLDMYPNELGSLEPTANEAERAGWIDDIDVEWDQSSDLGDTALPGSDDTATTAHRRAFSPSYTHEDVDDDPTLAAVDGDTSNDDDSGYDTPQYAAPDVHSRPNVDSVYDYGKYDASEDSDEEEEEEGEGEDDDDDDYESDSSEDSDSDDEDEEEYD
ncbi:hypothetical protein FB107DRAFT_291457 [Schizophyllum commune]